MKIVRVLNTNAVVSLDSYGREIIITGAGIGFKKKKGAKYRTNEMSVELSRNVQSKNALNMINIDKCT